jgi:hypothetical protein
MPRAGQLELPERGGCRGDGLSGAAGNGPVPLSDGVRDERVVPERLAVTAGAVTATFPKTIDELGRQRTLSCVVPVRKETSKSFRNATVREGFRLRKDSERSFRNPEG